MNKTQLPFTLRQLLSIGLLICALAALAWSTFFFYTRVYQTITAQSIIISLQPQVGGTTLQFEKLQNIIKKIEEKQQPVTYTTPRSNPFVLPVSVTPRKSTR